MKKTLLWLSVAVLAASCARRSSNDSSSVRISAAGSSAIAGTLTINSDCGNYSGTMSVSRLSSGQTFATQTVSNNGRFEFQVEPGSYTLSAGAGACYVSGTVQAYQPGTYNYNVCLGASCGNNTTYKATARVTPEYGWDIDGVPCDWGVYGCKGAGYPGKRNVGVGKRYIYINSKSVTDYKIDLTFEGGSNLVTAIPSLGMSGWNVNVGADGTLTVDGSQSKFLMYDAQTEEKNLNLSEGFCASRDDLVTKMVDYLKLSGFTEKVADDFGKHWANHMPPNPQLCAYAQTETELRRVVNMKAEPALNHRRLWFIIVPQLEEAVKRIVPLPTQFAGLAAKPKTDALSMLKKSPIQRTIANETDRLAEEWGVGFLIER